MTREINIILPEKHALTELSHDELIKQTKCMVKGKKKLDMNATKIKRFRLKQNTNNNNNMNVSKLF